MARMKVYTDRNSPAAARVTLSRMKNTVGTVPALAGVLAGSPNLLEAGTDFARAFISGSLKPAECYFILLVASREFGNEYCQNLVAQLASNTSLSASMIQAVRKRRTIRKKPFSILGPFVEAVVNKSGRVSDGDLETLRKAGYSEKQVLEILMGVSVAWFWSSVGAAADLTPAE